MSARSPREIHDKPTTPKRFATPRTAGKNRKAKQQITFDYDAAISQPDVPNFLDLKRNGRHWMVSGVLLRKRTLRNRIRSRVMSKKTFQKRSQALGAKSRAQKNAKSLSPNGNSPNGNSANIVMSPADSDEERDAGEKENVSSNGAVEIESSNASKKSAIMNGQHVLEDTSIGIAENNNKTQVIEKKVKNGYQDITTKSPVRQARGSRIPRAKIVAFPVHTIHEFHSVSQLNEKR
ncbi:uncharacterized protein LOC143186580 [Calliopsis andreniformis]|uniref:uncharacterized protein LOC143186580 n=1 Tax=Calliopsis andreniformis TaxID=337506 RepID=UPI003FCDD788